MPAVLCVVEGRAARHARAASNLVTANRTDERAGARRHDRIAAPSHARRGAVQGVGFRPFVHGLAREFELDGFVRNDAEGVLLEVEASA